MMSKRCRQHQSDLRNIFSDFVILKYVRLFPAVVNYRIFIIFESLIIFNYLLAGGPDDGGGTEEKHDHWYSG